MTKKFFDHPIGKRSPIFNHLCYLCFPGFTFRAKEVNSRGNLFCDFSPKNTSSLSVVQFCWFLGYLVLQIVSPFQLFNEAIITPQISILKPTTYCHLPTYYKISELISAISFEKEHITFGYLLENEALDSISGLYGSRFKVFQEPQ